MPHRWRGSAPTASAEAGSAAGTAAYAVDVSEQNFQTLLDASVTAPVVLVFYSPTRSPESVGMAEDAAIEILRLVALGHTNREIAASLSLSLATVERHLANIYARIGARGRADATLYAARAGLLNSDR